MHTSDRSPHPLDGHALAHSLERVASLVRRLASAGELSLTGAATLGSLSLHGPCRLPELARREGVTQPGMTQLVTRLERDGLAVRRGDPRDGRVVLVELTPAGEALLARRRDERAG